MCSRLPGGEGRQRQQPGEGISGQGWSVSLPGLDARVWQDLGSNETSLCAQGGAAELRVTVSSFPFPCRAVLLKTLQFNPNPLLAVLLSCRGARREASQSSPDA